MFARHTCFRLLVFSLGFFLPALVWAQGSPNWNWVQQGPSAVASGGRSITVAPSGNVFVTGYFTHTLTLGAITLITDSTDAFVAKYTAGGQVLWAQKLGSSGQGVGCQVIADASDNCYVSGVFRGEMQAATTLLKSRSDGDEFIVKYSAQGTPLWGQSYSDIAPIYYDYLFKTRYFPLVSLNMHLALDAQGNLYTAGSFRNTITRGTATFTAQGTNIDVLVVKYNAQGQVQWAQQGGGSGRDYAADITIDAAGSVYIVGGYEATATFGSVVFPSASNSSNNNYNTYILKYSAQGQPLWGQATVPASFQDYASLKSVSVDASGNVYVLGNFGPNLTLGTITFSLPQASSAHIFLAKYNPQGTVLWAKMAGSLPPNTVLVSNGYDLAVQADGTATITGTYSQSITFDQLTLGTPGGSNQTYVARYSPQGAVLWAGRAGTVTATPAGNTNIGHSVSVDAQGAAYVTGDFGGQADFGPFLLTNSTAMLSNLFVAKIGAATLAGRTAESASTLAVYPTPAAGASVTISFTQATPETIQLSVVNAVGQLVRQQVLPPGTSRYTVPISGLRAGVYWVQAVSATSRQVGTLVVP